MAFFVNKGFRLLKNNHLHVKKFGAVAPFNGVEGADGSGTRSNVDVD